MHWIYLGDWCCKTKLCIIFTRKFNTIKWLNYFYPIIEKGKGSILPCNDYIYYCGQENLRRNGVDIILNKRVQNAVLACNLKNKRMVSVCFQDKQFNISVIHVYAPNSNAEEAEVWMILWRPTRPFRTNTQKKMSLHYRGLECKSRKSRNTWSNRQIWPWSMEWSRAKANRVLPRECTGHSKHTFQQHKRGLYTWTSPDGQHQNQTDYNLWSWKWKSSIQLAKIRPGADCGSDHELLIAKFRGNH